MWHANIDRSTGTGTILPVEQREELNLSMAGLSKSRIEQMHQVCPDTSNVERCLGSLRSSAVMTTFMWRRSAHCHSAMRRQ